MYALFHSYIRRNDMQKCKYVIEYSILLSQEYSFAFIVKTLHWEHANMCQRNYIICFFQYWKTDWPVYLQERQNQSAILSFCFLAIDCLSKSNRKNNAQCFDDAFRVIYWNRKHSSELCIKNDQMNQVQKTN